MKCQILFFFLKNKKKYFKMSSAEIFTQHAKCEKNCLNTKQTKKKRKQKTKTSCKDIFSERHQQLAFFINLEWSIFSPSG